MYNSEVYRVTIATIPVLAALPFHQPGAERRCATGQTVQTTSLPILYFKLKF